MKAKPNIYIYITYVKINMDLNLMMTIGARKITNQNH